MLPWKIKVLENIKTERERDREGQKKEGGCQRPALAQSYRKLKTAPCPLFGSV